MANAMMVIKPYWDSGTWVFDDDTVGLVREPFVAGVPEMINHLVREIPNARSGFRLLFSAAPFPGFQASFMRVRGEVGGSGIAAMIRRWKVGSARRCSTTLTKRRQRFT